MDFILDILIFQNDLKKVGLSEEMVEWGGEMFSQVPQKYIATSKLKFIRNADMDYYKKIIGKNFMTENYVALTLEGEQILDLEISLNRNKSMLWLNEIVLFLSKICELNHFFILLLRDEEVIDKRYVVNKKEEIINLICSSLDWENPKGILIEKGKELISNE